MFWSTKITRKSFKAFTTRGYKTFPLYVVAVIKRWCYRHMTMSLLVFKKFHILSQTPSHWSSSNTSPRRHTLRLSLSGRGSDPTHCEISKGIHPVLKENVGSFTVTRFLVCGCFFGARPSQSRSHSVFVLRHSSSESPLNATQSLRSLFSLLVAQVTFFHQLRLLHKSHSEAAQAAINPEIVWFLLLLVTRRVSASCCCCLKVCRWF